MSVTINTGKLKIKGNDGNYIAMDAIANTSIEAIQDAASLGVSSIENAASQVTSQLASAGELEDMIAEAFDETKNYKAGDYVIHTDTADSINKLYCFTTDHAAGTWTGTYATAAVIGEDVSELKSAFNQAICSKAFSPAITADSYINKNSGARSASTSGKYASTSIINRDAEYIAIALDDSDYIFRLSFYDETGSIGDGTGYIGFTEFGDKLQYINANAAKFAVTFGRADEASLTDADIAAIKSRLVGYGTTDRSLKKRSAAADAYSTGSLSNVLNYTTIKWVDFASTTYPLGWRSGYWNDEGTISSASQSICLLGRIGFTEDNNRRNARLMRIIFPAGYNLVVKRFSYNQSGLMERLDFYDGFAIFSVNIGDRIAITLGGLNAPSSDYLTSEFISQIIGELADVSESIKYRDRTDEFIRFTVPINRKWPNVYSTTSDNAESDTEDYTLRCILTLPTTYDKYGSACPLIMFGHGASSRITDDSWYGNNSNFLAMIRKFTAAGYAVFDVDNTRNADGGYPDWGGLPLMEGYIKAWQYILENYNVEDKLYLLSCSMGTCANLMMMKWYPSQIVASIMTAPRPICKYRYTTAVEDPTMADYAETMAESFGLNDGVWDDNRLNGFDHWENIITLNDTPYILQKFPPIKALVGTGDPNFLEQTREFYQAVKNYGNFVDYREVTGGTHGQLSYLSIGNLKDEAVAFFDRFRYAKS